MGEKVGLALTSIQSRSVLDGQARNALGWRWDAQRARRFTSRAFVRHPLGRILMQAMPLQALLEYEMYLGLDAHR